MVTAELAMCLPVLMIVLAACIAVVTMLADRVRVQDAATEAARAAGRGDPTSAAHLVGELAPHGARLTLTRADGMVIAVVRVVVRPGGGSLGQFTVVERAESVDETLPPPGEGYR